MWENGGYSYDLCSSVHQMYGHVFSYIKFHTDAGYQLQYPHAETYCLKRSLSCCFHIYVHYRHLIPAPVNRTSATAWLYKNMNIMSKNKPNTSRTYVACESKLHSVVRSSMHPCTVNCIACGCTVVYFVRAAHAFSAVIICWHCIYVSWWYSLLFQNCKNTEYKREKIKNQWMSTC